MITILATTYAVNPFKGSEDGMGWNFVLQIARFNKVIAVTRENNRTAIEQYMAENPNELYKRIEFLYFDLPYWMRFWKKGGRGAMLYYQMWQKGVVSFVRKRKIQFDLVHNVNFHNDWSPSYLWKLGKPFVWGPIGHHPLIPGQYLKPYSFKYWIKDRLTWLIKKYYWNLSPNLRRCKKEAQHILCMNPDVPEKLKLSNNYTVMPSVATQDFGWDSHRESEAFSVISAGRFVPLKGFDLTLGSFAEMVGTLSSQEREKCRLTLVGTGEEEHLLKQQCHDLGINQLVSFVPWIERNELLQKFKKASVFLFPSHEGAGMVVAEALSFGVPVVCLDNEGPGHFIDDSCGIKVPQGSYSDTVSNLSQSLKKLFDHADLSERLRAGSRTKFESAFHWDRRGEVLARIFEKVALQSGLHPAQ